MGGFSSLGVIPFVRLGLGSRLWGMLMPVGPAFKLVSCRSPVRLKLVSGLYFLTFYLSVAIEQYSFSLALESLNRTDPRITRSTNYLSNQSVARTHLAPISLEPISLAPTLRTNDRNQ